MNSLHWHRDRGRYWLAHPSWPIAKGKWVIVAEAIISKYRTGVWQAWLRQAPGGPVTIIRCRNLHEAADCARRWAEYRGFVVSERFPEGGGK